MHSRLVSYLLHLGWSGPSVSSCCVMRTLSYSCCVDVLWRSLSSQLSRLFATQQELLVSCDPRFLFPRLAFAAGILTCPSRFSRSFSVSVSASLPSPLSVSVLSPLSGSHLSLVLLSVLLFSRACSPSRSSFPSFSSFSIPSHLIPVPFCSLRSSIRHPPWTTTIWACASACRAWKYRYQPPLMLS